MIPTRQGGIRWQYYQPYSGAAAATDANSADITAIANAESSASPGRGALTAGEAAAQRSP